MNRLFEAALELQEFMNQNTWPFCFIGGLAVIRWGEIRMTQDIDLCLMSGFGNEETYAQKLIGRFESRIADPLDFALTSRILLLSASNGIPIDVSLSGLVYEEDMIRRSTPFEFYPECKIITCSAEDLVVLKAFADRPKDWNDIESIVARQGGKLDTAAVIESLSPLCELKESPEIVSKLKRIIAVL
jgi:hypothetical protein